MENIYRENTCGNMTRLQSSFDRAYHLQDPLYLKRLTARLCQNAYAHNNDDWIVDVGHLQELTPELENALYVCQNAYEGALFGVPDYTNEIIQMAQGHPVKWDRFEKKIKTGEILQGRKYASVDELGLKSELEKLNEKLVRENINVDLHIVGGASMILNGYANRMTDDIDTIDEFSQRIEEIIAEVADENNFEPDWLNNDSGGLAPDVDYFAYGSKLDFSNLTCYVANDEYLLAAKLAAVTSEHRKAKREVDESDIKILLDKTKLTTYYEIMDVFRKFYHRFWRIESVEKWVRDFVNSNFEKEDE